MMNSFIIRIENRKWYTLYTTIKKDGFAYNIVCWCKNKTEAENSIVDFMRTHPEGGFHLIGPDIIATGPDF